MNIFFLCVCWHVCFFFGDVSVQAFYQLGYQGLSAFYLFIVRTLYILKKSNLSSILFVVNISFCFLYKVWLFWYTDSLNSPFSAPCSRSAWPWTAEGLVRQPSSHSTFSLGHLTPCLNCLTASCLFSLECTLGFTHPLTALFGGLTGAWDSAHTNLISSVCPHPPLYPCPDSTTHLAAPARSWRTSLTCPSPLCTIKYPVHSVSSRLFPHLHCDYSCGTLARITWIISSHPQNFLIKHFKHTKVQKVL